MAKLSAVPIDCAATYRDQLATEAGTDAVKVYRRLKKYVVVTPASNAISRARMTGTPSFTPTETIEASMANAMNAPIR